jgi:hypothetical protein
MMLLPMPLGPFLVEGSGQLKFRTPDTAPEFSFLWRKRCFNVKLATDSLSFAVPIGRLPSTSKGQAQRDAAMAVLRALGRQLPVGWRIHLLADHRIQLDARQHLQWPATAAALLTPIVRLVLQIAPLLDLIDETGLG